MKIFYICFWLRELGFLGFEVSHPFARKRAKGWGTGLFVEVRELFVEFRELFVEVRSCVLR